MPLEQIMGDSEDRYSSLEGVEVHYFLSIILIRYQELHVEEKQVGLAKERILRKILVVVSGKQSEILSGCSRLSFH